MRLLAVGFMFALAVSSCGGGAKPCTPKSCLGCCDEGGECLAGTGLLECGVSGAKCARCEVTDSCRTGLCEPLGDGGLYDGGTGGGTGGSGGMGGGLGGAGGGGGGGGGGALDAGKDGGTDAGKTDAGVDGGSDAGKADGGIDAGFDAGVDAGKKDGGDAG